MDWFSFVIKIAQCMVAIVALKCITVIFTALIVKVTVHYAEKTGHKVICDGKPRITIFEFNEYK